MKNFIRFLDTEFHSDFKKNIFFVFWTFFNSEINYSSNVNPNSKKNLYDFLMQNFIVISKKNNFFGNLKEDRFRI